MTELEKYFEPFRRNIIGINEVINTNGESRSVVYADWIASGRMYQPIEKVMSEDIYPLVANTHTETTFTGTTMTLAYNKAKKIIKSHVNASERDILISSNSGMTGVVNKFQRILGLKLHESFSSKVKFSSEERPIVFVTHMEHHSNQTSWIETIADVKIIQACPQGKVDLGHLESLLNEYKNREVKIAAITSCSNVTGIFTPYHEIAAIMHKHCGLCFVDFACSAPYIEINMHPADDPMAYLDAIYFSPHKFLGGPGSSGILIFDSKLYKNKIPDHPGGGTVDWTNPWGEHKYHEEIEAREDGGTPGFLQTIRVAMAIKLKDKMAVEKIHAREKEIIAMIQPRFEAIKNVHILADHQWERLPIISFIIENVHYNLVVKLLNDRFGIQTRGGCSCAGTYGHYLLEVSYEKSKSLTDQINIGDLSSKPGWVRISFHPTMTNGEIEYCMDAIEEVSKHHKQWAMDYHYSNHTNEYHLIEGTQVESNLVEKWFETSLV
jgi:selenocysteine lyase/cysteine desulfurase